MGKAQIWGTAYPNVVKKWLLPQRALSKLGVA
jgi:hypothetical protein